MAKVRRQNIFNTFFACIRFIGFWLAVFIQVPILFLMPRKFGVRYFSFFMLILMYVTGVRVRVHGQLSKNRPLMVVCNHISVFEFATFPIAMGGSFFAKKEMEKFPLVGWLSRKFGVIFIDRRPSQAMAALALVQKQMGRVSHPMFLFPEGTTTNGAYVKKFKSTLFNFIEGSNVTIQPIVMNYRFRNGDVISDEDMAQHFAYFNNRDQDMGPKCSRERSWVAQVFHIMVLGGFRVEVTILPPPPLAGMERKEIAETLHKIISDKYMELKDKRNEDSNNTNKG